MLPMTACQLLLGRPWQFDKKAMHNGEANTYTITHKSLRIELQPLPPDDDAPFPVTMLLTRDKKDCQPTSSRIKKRHKSPLQQSPPTHHAHDENLRANSFQQGENDENVMGLFTVRKLDKKTRKYLFNIVLANIRGLR